MLLSDPTTRIGKKENSANTAVEEGKEISQKQEMQVCMSTYCHALITRLTAQGVTKMLTGDQRDRRASEELAVRWTDPEGHPVVWALTYWGKLLRGKQQILPAKSRAQFIMQIRLIIVR